MNIKASAPCRKAWGAFFAFRHTYETVGAMKTTITQLLDDFDGTPDAETVTFAYQGARYEIELSEVNRKELDEALAPYIEHARQVGGTPKKAATKRKAKGPNPADVRKWASEHGVEVSPTGRIPRAVLDQYNLDVSKK